MEDAGLTCGAVCVYPNRVAECVEALKRYKAEDIPVAAVATGFPSGQMPLPTRLREIKMAVADGAKEIDIVINRQLALEQRWTELYEEVKQMKAACGSAHMKSILAIVELSGNTKRQPVSGLVSSLPEESGLPRMPLPGWFLSRRNWGTPG